MVDNDQKGGDLQEYIQGQLSLDKSEEEITENLKEMGWSEQEISNAFYEIKERKKKRKKRIITNSAATIAVIIAFALILLFAPNSPVKMEKKVVAHAAGEARTEIPQQNISENTTANLPGALRERLPPRPEEEDDFPPALRQINESR